MGFAKCYHPLMHITHAGLCNTFNNCIVKVYYFIKSQTSALHVGEGCDDADTRHTRQEDWIKGIIGWNKQQTVRTLCKRCPNLVKNYQDSIARLLNSELCRKKLAFIFFFERFSSIASNILLVGENRYWDFPHPTFPTPTFSMPEFPHT